VRHGEGDGLRPVVKAHVRQSTALSCDAIEAGHDSIGVDRALDVDGERPLGVLVDHVQ
jgi:hypothetical protein